VGTFSKQFLSAAVSGLPILLPLTSSPGTIVHAPPVAGSLDEVWIWGHNYSATPVVATFEMGTGPAFSGSLMKVTIPAGEGMFQIFPGLVFASGVGIRCFTATSGTCAVEGFVNRVV